MGVYIKGMEMPKSCKECLLNNEQMSCSVTGTYWWTDTRVLLNFDSTEERLYNCPLVEVPTTHGALVDKDELVKRFRLAIGTYLPSDPRKHMKPKDSFEVRGWTMGLRVVNHADAVIEAEKK